MGVYLNKNTFNPFDNSQFTQDYLAECKKIWAETTSNNVMPVFTLKHLSLITNTDYKKLTTYTHRRVNPYQKVIINSSDKKRELLIPWKELAIVQNWIKKHILDNVESSTYSTAYDKNCSIVKNANIHIQSPWLIKLDFKNFFNSIYENNVYDIFLSLGYSELFSLELARLCTVQKSTPKDSLPEYTYCKSKSHLPQGASTSPKLANLYARKFDEEVNTILQDKYSSFQLKFSRYSDDIIISGNLENKQNCIEVIEAIKSIINKYKLKLNHKKTKVFSPSSIKKVTGITIIDGELRPSRSILNYVQTSLYYIDKFSIEEHITKMNSDYNYDIETYKEHLLGKIFFIKFVNNNIGSKLLERYNQVCL